MAEKSELLRVPAFADLPDDQIAFLKSYWVEAFDHVAQRWRGQPAEITELI